MKLVNEPKLSYRLSHQLLGLHQAANVDPELQVMISVKDNSCGQIMSYDRDMILIAALELKAWGVIFAFNIQETSDHQYYFELPSTFSVEKLEAFCGHRN